MVAAARGGGIDALLGDVRDWVPNRTQTWSSATPLCSGCPTTRICSSGWARQLVAGSWIAIQVPGNFDAPSHRAVRQLARHDRWAELLRDFPFREGQVADLPGYADLLTDAACTVDAWETTYVHVLTGENPVLEWITGTALRPVRSRLTDSEWAPVPHRTDTAARLRVSETAGRQDVLPVSADLRGGSGGLNQVGGPFRSASAPYPSFEHRRGCEPPIIWDRLPQHRIWHLHGCDVLLGEPVAPVFQISGGVRSGLPSVGHCNSFRR